MATSGGMSGPRVVIDGMDNLRRVLRQAGGSELQRELGQVHRQIGEMVIARAGGRQTDIGSGAGSRIRPSSAAREVQLRVGGRHRDDRKEQWGKQQRWPGGQAPQRPLLIQHAVDIQPAIEQAYMRGVEQIFQRLR